MVSDARLLSDLAALLVPLARELPSTRGPRNQLPLTPVQEAARQRVYQAERDDAEAQQWRVLAARTRAGRALPQPGWGSVSPVPINIAVSDAIAAVTVGIIELHEAVCDALGLTAPHVDTLDRRLLHLRACLTKVQDYPVLAVHVRREMTQMIFAAQLAITPPARAYVGLCPECGEPTLQVDFDSDVITCVNRECDCGMEDCPCQDGRRHQWGRPDWGRLALRMKA